MTLHYAQPSLQGAKSSLGKPTGLFARAVRFLAPLLSPYSGREYCPQRAVVLTKPTNGPQTRARMLDLPAPSEKMR